MKEEEQSLRNLGLDLIRATEMAALRAGRWMGFGVQPDAELLAARAMSEELAKINVLGKIICSDRKQTQFLQIGSFIGQGDEHAVDYAVDPIDGSRLLATGGRGAISAIVGTTAGAMYAPYPARYMEKLVVDSEVAQALVPECLDAPIAWTLGLIGRVKKLDVSRLVIFMLDRPRNQPLIDEIREAGARVMLRSDGDIAGALHALNVTDMVDALMGIGGVTEGVMSAAAVKARGGAMLARLAPQSEKEHNEILQAGIDISRILTQDDMIKTERFFFVATGLTDGRILEGLRYDGGRATSHSLILRGKTKTRRIIHAEHLFEI